MYTIFHPSTLKGNRTALHMQCLGLPHYAMHSSSIFNYKYLDTIDLHHGMNANYIRSAITGSHNYVDDKLLLMKTCTGMV